MANLEIQLQIQLSLVGYLSLARLSLSVNLIQIDPEANQSCNLKFMVNSWIAWLSYAPTCS